MEIHIHTCTNTIAIMLARKIISNSKIFDCLHTIFFIVAGCVWGGRLWVRVQREKMVARCGAHGLWSLREERRLITASPLRTDSLSVRLVCCRSQCSWTGQFFHPFSFQISRFHCTGYEFYNSFGCKYSSLTDEPKCIPVDLELENIL